MFAADTERHEETGFTRFGIAGGKEVDTLS